MHIAIAALTRRRPKLFEGLLESLAHLRTPDGARIDCIAVFMILAPLTLGRSLFSGLRAFGFAAGLGRAVRGHAL